ncbi:MAG: hypothetical protein IPP74_05400 [Alphaproteobacteria bacterium]|nr:hypothetical protein [Alphaproteobacteria bacterium]
MKQVLRPLQRMLPPTTTSKPTIFSQPNNPVLVINSRFHSNKIQAVTLWDTAFFKQSEDQIKRIQENRLHKACPDALSAATEKLQAVNKELEQLDVRKADLLEAKSFLTSLLESYTPIHSDAAYLAKGSSVAQAEEKLQAIKEKSPQSFIELVSRDSNNKSVVVNK